MIHPYNVVTEHEGSYDNLFEVYSFLRIFKGVWDEYEDKETATKIIKFIAYGFSLESTKITVNGDLRKELTSIFYDLELDKEMLTEVVLLENPTIRKACEDWLEKQGEPAYEYLMTLKLSYIQQQSAALSPLKKADGITRDYDQNHKCIEHGRELRVWIKEAEAELIQNNPKMKKIFEEFDLDNTVKKSKKTTSFESKLREHENGTQWQ